MREERKLTYTFKHSIYSSLLLGKRGLKKKCPNRTCHFFIVASLEASSAVPLRNLNREVNTVKIIDTFFVTFFESLSNVKSFSTVRGLKSSWTMTVSTGIKNLNKLNYYSELLCGIERLILIYSVGTFRIHSWSLS